MLERDLTRPKPQCGAETSAATAGLVRNLIERVLGDRERHQAGVLTRPCGNADWLDAVHSKTTATENGSSVTLRIYVATSQGQHLLIDDRAEGRSEDCLGQRIEIVHAEYREAAKATEADEAGYIRVTCRSECKGEMLYMLGEDNKARPRRDYIAFIDDDIEVRASDLLKGAEQAHARGFAAFQLELTADSHAVWSILKQEASDTSKRVNGQGEIWSEIPFIEIMAPVIAQGELDNGLLEILRPFKSGFGWDFYLLPCLCEIFSDFRLGLYRGSAMRHTRSVQTKNETRFSNGLTAVEEEEIIRASIILTLIQYGKTDSIPDRKTFLAEMKAIVIRDSEEHRKDVLAGIAAGLSSVSNRYWLCRRLEEELVQEKELLSLERQKCHVLATEKTDLEAHERFLKDEHERQVRSLLSNCREIESTLNSEIRRLNSQAEELQSLNADQAKCIEAIHKSLTWRIGRLFMMPVRIAKTRIGSITRHNSLDA